MLKRTCLASLPFLLDAAACAAPSHDTQASSDDALLTSFTAQDRLDEAAWVTSQFDNYYGPLEFKQASLGFDWETTKTDYRKAASDPATTHAVFEQLTAKLVAKFHDAHTAPSFFRYAYTGAKSYATLGFVTAREVDAAGTSKARVTRIYPGALAAGSLVTVGDELISIGGRDVATIIAEDIVAYRNLGQPESNLTFGYAQLGLRSASSNPALPAGDVDVVIDHGGTRHTVRMAWMQANYEDLVPPGTTAAVRTQILSVNDDATVTARFENNALPTPFFASGTLPASMMLGNFERPDALPASLGGATVGADYPTDTNDIVVDGLSFKLMMTAKGLTAIYRVADFTDSRVVWGPPTTIGMFTVRTGKILTGEAYAGAFNKLSSFGVKAVVLDLRGNPGGQLNYGYELARAFTGDSKPINPANVVLNEDWLTQFRSAANATCSSLSARQSYRDQLTVLEADVAAGKRTSRDVYLGGASTLGGVVTPYNAPVFMLADEMCASMCDIFTTLMQDYGRAKMFGTRTMGAGGNVIGVGMSTRTKISLTQTASLIRRLDGRAVENAGASPDVTILATPTYFADVKKALESAL